MASSKFILMERFRRLTSKDFTQVPSDPIELERMEQGRKREDEQRQQIRILFDAIDSDGNKHITTSEMKKYIRDNKPHALAPGISKKILKMADGDGNGQLDFEEFYILTKIPKLNWLFQYVNLVEPPRRGPPDDDEYAEYGAYENMMKCWPLPIMMILFSVLEIAVYLVDEK